MLKTCLPPYTNPQYHCPLTAYQNGQPGRHEDVREVYIDPVMEKRIIRKFDMFALSQYTLIIILAYLDRTNIGMLPVLPALCFAY